MEFEVPRNQEGRPGAAALGVAIWPNENQRRIRVAWLCYVAGPTRAQIGRRLGFARARVNRLLANGTVQLHIHKAVVKPFIFAPARTGEAFAPQAVRADGIIKAIIHT